MLHDLIAMHIYFMIDNAWVFSGGHFLCSTIEEYMEHHTKNYM